MALNAYITSAGVEVLNKYVGRQSAMLFSRAQIGGGVCTDPVACKALTALVSPYTTSAIASKVSVLKAAYQSGAAKVSIQFDNTGVSQTVSINELGLYVVDPDTSTDVLYCYATFGDGTTPDIITSDAIFTRVYDLIVAVTGVTSVAVSVTPTGLQSVITAVGLLVGDGNGGVREAVAGTDFAAPNHTHGLSSTSITGTLPIAKGGTGATTAATARANLEVAKVIYSATTPTYEAGAIWLKPV